MRFWGLLSERTIYKQYKAIKVFMRCFGLLGQKTVYPIP